MHYFSLSIIFAISPDLIADDAASDATLTLSRHYCLPRFLSDGMVYIGFAIR